MPTLQMFDMTSEEMKALDPAKTCIFFTVSPIEEHGPHLPLGTDIIEADGMVDRIVERVAGDFPTWNLLRYPPIPLGVDGFEYPGTASVRPETLRAVMNDLVDSFAHFGFHRFIVASHHGSPRHNLAIEDAAKDIARRSDARLLAVASKVIVDLYLDGGLAEFYRREGIDPSLHAALDVDCHAGAFETAEVMALRPDLVRDEYADLPPVLVPLERLTQLSALLEGEGLGYFGIPDFATPELGESYIEFVIDRVYGEVVEFLESGRYYTLPRRWRLALEALTLVSRVREKFQRLSM